MRAQVWAPLLLLLLGGGAGTLNATPPLRRDPAGEVEWRRPLLERTRPFVLVGGQRRSLKEALQDGHPERLRCGLKVGGELLVLELRKNRRLLPKAPDIFLYLANGTGVSVTDEPATHCYYHGDVRGFPGSRAAISTCSGLRGVIALNSSLSFEVEPQERRPLGKGGGVVNEAGQDGEHLIFSGAHAADRAARGCGVPHGARLAARWHSATRRRSKRDILSETKYIELVLVADHQEFLNYQRNNKTIIYRLMDVANQVDWYYRPLKVRVALTGLEVWSDRDKIRIEKNPSATLNNFLLWRSRELLPRLRHDNAQLVMGSSLDGTTVGMAAQASMCSRDRSGGVNVDHLVSVLGVASTVAHELGHNLGMSHDTRERRCGCADRPRWGGCIMEPSTGFLPGQRFSSCSASDLSLSLLRGGGMCLFNVPAPERLLGGPRCGNLYVEPGEECDCGLLEECRDPCCDASACRLRPGARCSSDGVCCLDCQLRAAGSVCREPVGECDLPEFCTGSSPQCPPNVYVQNGESCEDGAAYCYDGTCASMRAQCRTLWGANASAAPAVCFSSVNKQGNKYGNCGQLADGSYVACAPSDAQCGRIQCQGGLERPLLGSDAEILTTTVRLDLRDLVCRGTVFHLGDDVSDPASVAQGTACGPGKACLEHKCRDVSVLGVDRCRKKCNGRGLCNSNNNCHCRAGWAPPDCAYAGHGGSVDSGPVRAARRTLARTLKDEDVRRPAPLQVCLCARAESDPVLVALLLLFAVVVPALLLFLALRFPGLRRLRLALGGAALLPKSSRNRATERAGDGEADQARPPRWVAEASSPDVPGTPPLQELGDRPAPPAKPLPPAPPPPQAPAGRAAAPTRPLPPDPASPAQAWPGPPADRPRVASAADSGSGGGGGGRRPCPSRPAVPPRPERR